jgi:hypothetical protein
VGITAHGRLLDVCCVSYDKDGGRSSDEGF